jgi:hypothetical protein
VKFTKRSNVNGMMASAAELESSSIHRHYSSNVRKQIFATWRENGHELEHLKKAPLVKMCLFFSLIATMVHQLAMHRRYLLLSDGKGSLREVVENTFYSSPVVPDGDRFGSTRNVSFHATRKKPRRFVPAPAEYAKLAYFYGGISHKLYEPVIRAFHSRGWSITKDEARAHVFWFDQPDDLMDYHRSIKPWQRINQIPHTDLWDDKDTMAQYINRYYDDNKRDPLHSFLETYVVNDPSDLKRFQERLLQGGLDIPWVIKQPTVNQGLVGP